MSKDTIKKVKRQSTGLPWWRSGWESACWCRGRGFEPWSGRIPRATDQLGPWATTTEPARLEPVPRNGRGRDSKRPAHRDEERSLHRDEEWPPLAVTRESPRTNRRPNTAKNKEINKVAIKLKKKKKKKAELKSEDKEIMTSNLWGERTINL